jgi:hypothetical protein
MNKTSVSLLDSFTPLEEHLSSFPEITQNEKEDKTQSLKTSKDLFCSHHIITICSLFAPQSQSSEKPIP